MSKFSWRLEGRVALITGASSGLGLHFARTLAAEGATVALAARRRATLDGEAAAIQAAGGRALAVTMDVTGRESVATALATIEQRLGPIDVLVNNSGVTVTGPALEQTDADWDYVLDTNLKGAVRVALAVGQRMRDSGRGGSIINIASILGLRQAGNVSAYASSKAALIQFTKTLALEVARHDIRVNAIAPGYFATDLNADFWTTSAGLALIKRIPQRRLGELAELDGPLLLLASDASRYMTGTVLVVDGGHLVSTL
jgi:NAD(P)-dependent dehydrogenase (short-subunit alcohol dehydrogenase family)